VSGVRALRALDSGAKPAGERPWIEVLAGVLRPEFTAGV
jgi:hypothetical protein